MIPLKPENRWLALLTTLVAGITSNSMAADCGGSYLLARRQQSIGNVVPRPLRVDPAIVNRDWPAAAVWPPHFDFSADGDRIVVAAGDYGPVETEKSDLLEFLRSLVSDDVSSGITATR